MEPRQSSLQLSYAQKAKPVTMTLAKNKNNEREEKHTGRETRKSGNSEASVEYPCLGCISASETFLLIFLIDLMCLCIRRECLYADVWSRMTHAHPINSDLMDCENCYVTRLPTLVFFLSSIAHSIDSMYFKEFAFTESVWTATRTRYRNAKVLKETHHRAKSSCARQGAAHMQ